MKVVSAVALLIPLASALWPVPSNYSLGESTLWIDKSAKISYNGHDSSQSYNSIFKGNNTALLSAQIVKAAIARTYNTILYQGYVPWKFHPRNAPFEPPTSGKTMIKQISLVQTGADPQTIFKPLAGEIDESYTLGVSPAGEVTISAKTSIGLVRGLTTFTQLFYKHSKGGTYTPYAPVYVQDAPKFVHRGLNMDVSRNYYPVPTILKMIDNLAYSKFNRLHLHITDAQSWPLVIPSMPELSEKGAYRTDLVYTPADLASIQSYGALQGVEVYLEIDQPGHTSSIWFSHPELVAAFNVQPNWDTYAAEPPSGTLKLNSTAVYDFLEKLFNDLLPRVYPYTSYFHTGGDEVNVQAYLLDDTVRSNLTSVLQPLMQRFVDRNHDQVRALGLTPIVWEEMLLQWNLTLGEDVVVQTWQSDGALAETVAAGHKALAGNYNYWYLDCGQGQWLDFRPGTSSQNFWPYADYCSPRKNWRLIYSYDPLHGVPENATHLVLGGEVHIWSEQTDPVNLDKMVWPRAAAAAEVLWSGAKDPVTGQNRSQVEASPRLSDMRERLVAMGVGAEPIQMPFCIMNGTQCAL